MIRAAIVGLGWWGQTLVNSVHAKTDAIRFVACHVRTKARAEAFCREKGLTYIGTFDEVLADPTIDAVVLATPHSEHGAQIERAAAAGKHIYVEKPFTLDVASADKALAAVRKAGVTLAVGFQRRFAPNFVELKARVQDGRLGTIAHSECEANAHAGLVMAADSWRTNPEQAPAGAMTALGIHTLDGMIDLFGEIDELICLNVRRTSALVDDTTSVMMRFKSGMTGTLICCLATAPGYRVTAFGAKGYAEISGAGLDVLRITSLPSGPPGTPPPAPEVIERKADALKLALEAFGTAAAGGAPYPTTHDQIRHGVAAFAAIVRSAKSGRFEKVS
jgi:predicted dehydrogenase